MIDALQQHNASNHNYIVCLYVLLLSRVVDGRQRRRAYEGAEGPDLDSSTTSAGVETRDGKLAARAQNTRVYRLAVLLGRTRELRSVWHLARALLSENALRRHREARLIGRNEIH